MVNIRLATEEDKEEWNKVAYESPEATYAHTWEWKAVIEKGFGIESLSSVAEDNTGEIVGIYSGFLQPLKTKNFEGLSKRFKVLESPFRMTWDYGGPCILPDTDEKVLEELVIRMENFAKEKGAISLRVSPFEGDALKKIMLKRDYKVSERLTSVIDLTKGEEELWKGLSGNARRYVRKAEKNGIITAIENDYHNMEKVYECVMDIGERKNISIPPFIFFENIFKRIVPKNANIIIAKWNDKIIGAILNLSHNEDVVMRYGGGIKKYMDLHTYYALYWATIKEYSKDEKYKYLDLGECLPTKQMGFMLLNLNLRGKSNMLIFI